jgi:hypothetical protein
VTNLVEVVVAVEAIPRRQTEYVNSARIRKVRGRRPDSPPAVASIWLIKQEQIAVEVSRGNCLKEEGAGSRGPEDELARRNNPPNGAAAPSALTPREGLADGNKTISTVDPIELT